MFISEIFFPYEVLVSLNPCTDCALEMHAHDALNLFFKIGFLHLLHLYCRFVWDNYFVEKNEHSPCSNDVSTSIGTSCRLSNFERGAVVAVSRFPMLLLTLVGTVGNFVTGTTFRRGLLLTNRTPIGSLFQLV